MSLTFQYIVVGLILIGIAIFVVVRFLQLRRGVKQKSCCGCSLSDSCNQLKKNKGCHENN